jgi:hypothetical protein
MISLHPPPPRARYRLRKDLPYQLTAAAFTADGKVRSDFIWWEILNEKGRSMSA